MNDESRAGRTVDILLVDDNPADVELMREALEIARVSNRLHVVDDGTEAIDFLHQLGKYQNAPHPDIILLDLNLPRKDGREVLSEIKKNGNLAQIPVVVLSTSQADEDILRAYQLHANCYIVKPVDFCQFQRIVAAINEFWLNVAKLPGKAN